MFSLIQAAIAGILGSKAEEKRPLPKKTGVVFPPVKRAKPGQVVSRRRYDNDSGLLDPLNPASPLWIGHSSAAASCSAPADAGHSPCHSGDTHCADPGHSHHSCASSHSCSAASSCSSGSSCGGGGGGD